jgi:hypothetical protein
MVYNESAAGLATSKKRLELVMRKKLGGYFDTPEQAGEFLKKLGLLKKRRRLEGEELEQVLTMLRLLGPGEQTNNQHVWTESWRVGNIEYNHHTGDGFEELEEVIDDE